MTDKLPWDADCGATKAGLERFMRALVVVRGHFTDSFSLVPISKPSTASVFFRVWLMPGTEQQFMTLAGIESVRPPPRVHIGLDRPPDDGRRVITREVTHG